ncbi:MAG: enoyl-CoA hydratase/isomerase family protein [Smithellaceae bacterium]
MGTDKYETLEIEKRGAICIVSFNTPEKMNALSHKFVTEFNRFFIGMHEDFETRVIILKGNGKVFCAGTNLDEVSMEPPEGMGEIQHRYYAVTQGCADMVLNMRRCSQPIIGAIHGFAIGGGFSIALACDIRIAGESTKMNAGYIKVGLAATDMGSSFYFPKIVGYARAAEYLFTGRFMDAATAERFGLVSKVVPDAKVLDAALEIAEEMLLTAPFGLCLTKEGLNASLDGLSLENIVRIENRNQVLCLSTADGKEGIAAMKDKRKAVFRNL